MSQKRWIVEVAYSDVFGKPEPRSSKWRPASGMTHTDKSEAKLESTEYGGYVRVRRTDLPPEKSELVGWPCYWIDYD